MTLLNMSRIGGYLGDKMILLKKNIDILDIIIRLRKRIFNKFQ